jgi:hypothetical protein
MSSRWILPLIVLAGGTLAAQEKGWGVQGAVLVPQSGDLRDTTGSGPHLSVGLHGTWSFGAQGRHLLRPRLDASFFQKAEHHTDLPDYSQDLRTRVSSLAAGVEYLFRFQGQRPLAIGAGVYEIRWSVDSTNRVRFPEGTASQTGTSHWTRLGAGLLATWRLSPAWEVEARTIESRYGYENHRIHTASLGVLWHF